MPSTGKWIGPILQGSNVEEKHKYSRLTSQYTQASSGYIMPSYQYMAVNVMHRMPVISTYNTANNTQYIKFIQWQEHATALSIILQRRCTGWTTTQAQSTFSVTSAGLGHSYITHSWAGWSISNIVAASLLIMVILIFMLVPRNFMAISTIFCQCFIKCLQCF